jgi:hypothetical protein
MHFIITRVPAAMLGNVGHRAGPSVMHTLI